MFLLIFNFFAGKKLFIEVKIQIFRIKPEQDDNYYPGSTIHRMVSAVFLKCLLDIVSLQWHYPGRLYSGRGENMKELQINLEHCVGCKSCEIAYAVEHSVSKNIYTAILRIDVPVARVFVERTAV